jgi:HEAT repeat protein
MNNLDTLIAALAHDDETERGNAAEDLGYSNAPDAILPLLERLTVEASRKVRETIFLALERIDSPAIPIVVAALLESDDAFLRNQAIGLLQRKGAAAAAALLARMNDADPDVRKFVLDAAAGIASPAVEPIYDAALRDQDPNVVIATLEYLGAQRKRRFKPEAERIFLTAEEPMLVCAAFTALLEIGDAESWRCIRQRYPSVANVPHWQRGWWIRALGEFGPADEIEVFHALLKDEGGGFPADAIDALERFQDRHGRVPISEGFWQDLRDLAKNQMAPEAKFQLLRVVGGFGAPVGIGDHLLAMLEQGDRLTKLGAIKGLARLGRPDLRARVLARGSLETDPEVAEALREYGSSA